MTSYGPPNQPYPPTAYGYGQQQQPAPPLGAPPPFPLWPVIVVTVFFSLFGLIPTIIGSNRASQRREDSSRYWIAFVLSLLGAFVLYAIVVVVMVFVVFASTVAVVGNAIQALPTYSPSPFATSTTTGGTTGATTGPCAYTPAPGANVTSAPLPPDPAVTPTDTRTWTVVTSAGTIVIELDGAAAPCTVQSIVSLTGYGYYDDTPCPRSVDSGIFVLQCGDPSGTTAGGPGYTFADENLAAADYSAGTVAMANSGPDTNGSQFFLIDKDANGALSKDYTAFGTITQGLDVLDKIVAAGNDGSNPSGGGAPKTPVSITSATVS